MGAAACTAVLLLLLVLQSPAEGLSRSRRGLADVIRTSSSSGGYVDPNSSDSCVCVPFYDCEDGRVLSGRIKFGPRSQCKNFNICCNVPDDVTKQLEKKPGVNKGVLSSISDGISDIFSGSAIDVSTGGKCACVAWYQCDGGVLAPELARQIDRRQISATGRCSSSDEKCCTLPAEQKTSTTSLPPCECVELSRCRRDNVQPLRVGSQQPACRSDQVCCTSPEPVPLGGSVVAQRPLPADPSQPAPDYDLFKFCKNYPLSIACVASRQLNGVPTLRPHANFKPDADAAALKSAIGYFDADDDVLIEILTKRTFTQRWQIAQAYGRLVGDDVNELSDDIGGTTRGHFDDLMRALLRSPSYYAYVAQSLYDSMHGLGTDEDVVLETVLTSTADELDNIKRAYLSIDGEHTLLADIQSDFGGDLRDLLVAVVNNTRDRSFAVSRDRARDQAVALYQAGQSLGTDEQTFKYYLTHESYPQLALIFAEFEEISGKPFTEALEDEFSRHVEDAVLAIVEVTRNLPRYFAIRLHDALWGRGLLTKDDSSLIRLIISRAEIDLATIGREYHTKYGRHLVHDIQTKSTGDYETALVALCGGEPPEGS